MGVRGATIAVKTPVRWIYKPTHACGPQLRALGRLTDGYPKPEVRARGTVVRKWRSSVVAQLSASWIAVAVHGRERSAFWALPGIPGF
jgi:hypothetical protein